MRHKLRSQTAITELLSEPLGDGEQLVLPATNRSCTMCPYKLPHIASKLSRFIYLLANHITRYLETSGESRPRKRWNFDYQSKMKFESSDGYVTSDVVRLLPLLSIEGVTKCSRKNVLPAKCRIRAYKVQCSVQARPSSSGPKIKLSP
jgi:hypothetical protein